MERPSEEIIQKMYEKAKADWTIKSDKEFVDRVVANWWYTEKEMMKWLAYDKDWNFVEAPEQDYTVDNDSPINDVEPDNSYWWGRAETDYDTNKEDAVDLWQDAAWAAASNPWILKNIPIGNIPNKLFNWVVNGISNKILSNPKASEYLMEKFADNAFKIFDPKKDKAIIDELISASKNAVWDKADDATRAVADKVSEETKKKIVWKLLWTIVQWLYTDYKMIHDTNKDNKSWLNKDARWASALDAVDSATETLPVVNWVDLWLDLALSWSKDKNWESYSKWWLLSKINYLVNDLSWDWSARTIWENDPEKQEEIKKWMNSCITVQDLMKLNTDELLNLGIYQRINQIIKGWINYFKIGSMKKWLSEIFGPWLRHKVRVIIVKQWKKPPTIYANLMKINKAYNCGFSDEDIYATANTRLGWYRMCGKRTVSYLLSADLLSKPNKKRNRPGLVNPLLYYLK